MANSGLARPSPTGLLQESCGCTDNETIPYNVCSVPWGYHEHHGDIMSTMGDIMSTMGDIMSTMGDIMSTMGNIVSTVGDITINVGDITINVGDITINVGDIMTTMEVFSTMGYSNNKRLFPPWYSRYPPNFIMITPHGTQDIPPHAS